MLTKEYVLNDSMIDQIADRIIVPQAKEDTALPLSKRAFRTCFMPWKTGLLNTSVKERLDEL